MSDPERAREAAQWLKIADEDRRVALSCRLMTPPAINSAAYHCQQAAEKLLKGLLVLAGVHFPKTHDLLALSQLAAPFYPEDRAILAETIPLTAWAVVYRYPGVEKQSSPEESELDDALALITRLAVRLRQFVDPIVPEPQMPEEGPESSLSPPDGID